MRLALNYNNYRLVWPRERSDEQAAGAGVRDYLIASSVRARYLTPRTRTDAPMIKQHGIIINFAPR